MRASAIKTLGPPDEPVCWDQSSLRWYDWVCLGLGHRRGNRLLGNQRGDALAVSLHLAPDALAGWLHSLELLSFSGLGSKPTAPSQNWRGLSFCTSLHTRVLCPPPRSFSLRSELVVER